MEMSESAVDGPAGPAPGREDNSLSRLFGLSDAVFAISLTLLVLDLKVPDLSNPTNAQLMHAVAAESSTFLSYLLSFYVVAGRWVTHRTLMRSVTASHPRLVQHTLFLLLLVGVLPYPGSLLGNYASEPISVVIYGTVNALAALTLLLLQRDVRALGLSAAPTDRRIWVASEWALWLDLLVFLLSIPAAYLFGVRGTWVYALLVLHRFTPLWRRWRRPPAAS